MSFSGQARASTEATPSDQTEAAPRSSSRPADEDPFLVWLARQPVGQPLSAKERERLAMAKQRIAADAPRRSTEDLLSAARALHGQ